MSKLKHCDSEIKKDRSTFGIACVKSLLEFQRLDVEHSTDIARLKKDAASVMNDLQDVSLENSPNLNDIVLIQNATILTMEYGNQEADIIHHGFMIVQGGIIQLVDSGISPSSYAGATVIDAKGGEIDSLASVCIDTNSLPLAQATLCLDLLMSMRTGMASVTCIQPGHGRWRPSSLTASPLCTSMPLFPALYIL